MIPTSSSQLWIIVLLLSFVFLWLFKRRASHQRVLPPGPPGWPIFGNLMDIPTQDGWLKYAALSRQYGDMIYLEVLGQPMLILNSLQRVTDLFDKRSLNYSDRPQSRMLVDPDLMGWNWNASFLSYNEEWKRRRRILHAYFHQNNSETNYHVYVYATHKLLQDLSRTPDQFFDHLRRHAGTIILKTVYGHDVQAKDDPLIRLAESALQTIMEYSAGGIYLVDTFPFLKHVPEWFPGAHFRRLASRSNKLGSEMVDQPFQNVKSLMINKSVEPCLVTNYLQELEEKNDVSNDQEQVIKEAAAVAYAGGSDTTTSSLLTFVLTMILYPEVQKKAQAEIDSVVGHDRLPTFGDRSDLPYIHAIMLETQRWHPVTPLGIIHQSREEDMYNGYRIPAGTICIPNMWAMLHEEQMYPNSDAFVPERFLKQEGKQLPLDPTNVVFGFGRRICPGQALALDSIWIAMVSILSSFNIEKALDSNGKEIAPEVSYTSGNISYPKHFKCRFIPRSKRVLDIITSGA